MSTQPSRVGAHLAPYRNPRLGDLIIRAYDSIEFHVYKAILADASSVFADMVSLPQPVHSATGDSDGKPVVDVAESGSVWGTLLRFCYAPGPPAPADFVNLTALRLVLDAALKYQMDGVVELVRLALLFPQFVEKAPFDVYALACVYKFPEAARCAARQSLRFPQYTQYSREIDYLELPLRAYNRLADYRRECGAVAQKLVGLEGSYSSLTPTRNYVYSSLPTALFQEPCSNSCVTLSPSCFVYDERPSYVRFDSTRAVRATGLQYLRTLKSKFECLPDSGLALSKPLLSAIIEPASKCPRCAGSIHKVVDEFSAALYAALEHVISRVELVVDR